MTTEIDYQAIATVAVGLLCTIGFLGLDPSKQRQLWQEALDLDRKLHPDRPPIVVWTAGEGDAAPARAGGPGPGPEPAPGPPADRCLDRRGGRRGPSAQARQHSARRGPRPSEPRRTMNETVSIEVPKGSAPMSLHFSDADPVAECHLAGCRWHGHGDSVNDAVLAWTKHLSTEHSNDWE